MKSTINKKTDTHVTFTVQMDEHSLAPIVDATYNRLRQNVKVAGFRPGKAPNAIVDRELGTAVVQAEVLDAATNHSYSHAIREHSLPVIARPEVKLSKFVPYTELEYEATAEVLAEIKLADYKKLKTRMPAVEVEDKEIDQVIDDLRKRVAKRTDADRAAKMGDEVVFDFEGTKDGKPVAGAKSANYPLVLGSKSFIPGFEEELVGLKAGDEKTFDITFPKDYQPELAGQKVTFKIKVNRVVEVALPEINDELATEIGGVKSLVELRKSVEASLLDQKVQAVERQYENSLLQELLKGSSLKAPESMIDQQKHRLKHELEENLQQRGMTLEQYASAQGTKPEAVQKELDEEAKRRVELALVLTEVAKVEKIEVTDDEIDGEIEKLKMQYTDAEMQKQIDRPETREEIYNHLMATKTIAKIKGYNEGS